MYAISGLDLRLIKSLGLPQSTKHMFVSYMGCHAGLIGLRTAAEIARADPKNRVLVISSEVNSVNAQAPDPEHPVNNIIVDIIFGDGGAGRSILSLAFLGLFHTLMNDAFPSFPLCDKLLFYLMKL